MKTPLLQRDRAAGALVAAVGLLLVVAALASVGRQPYGQQALQDEIARYDGDQCSRFGFEAGTQKLSDCITTLTDLRTSHDALLIAYSRH